MDATLGQAAKILSMFEDTPRAQVQALLKSGLLADLRDANFDDIRMERDEFRRLLGLKPLVLIGTAVVFELDMRKDGWTLLEDVQDPDPETAFANGLESVPFLEYGEECIDDEKLVLRARGKLRANYGQRHAEYLLGHQEGIPEEFQKYYLVFTGTVWRAPDGCRRGAYLYWYGGHWHLDFFWFDHLFRPVDRLVRPRE